jgi:hypothetical protein
VPSSEGKTDLLWARNPGVLRVTHRKVGELKGREGHEEVETPSSSTEEREDLRGLKSQESKRPRPELILREAREGHGFSGGIKPLEHRY